MVESFSLIPSLVPSLSSTCRSWRCLYRFGRRLFAFRGSSYGVGLSGVGVSPGFLGRLFVSLSVRGGWGWGTSVRWILPFWQSGSGVTSLGRVACGVISWLPGMGSVILPLILVVGHLAFVVFHPGGLISPSWVVIGRHPENIGFLTGWLRLLGMVSIPIFGMIRGVDLLSLELGSGGFFSYLCTWMGKWGI